MGVAGVILVSAVIESVAESVSSASQLTNMPQQLIFSDGGVNTEVGKRGTGQVPGSEGLEPPALHAPCVADPGWAMVLLFLVLWGFSLHGWRVSLRVCLLLSLGVVLCSPWWHSLGDGGWGRCNK